MRKSLLSGLLSLLALTGSAQCVPDPIYQDSLFGAWPDTTENFLPGIVGVPYSDTLYLLVPNSATLIDPGLPNITIDSVIYNSISGLPPGITVQCNSQTSAPCTFLTNQVGCGLLTGVPTTAGTYEMVVNVTAYASLLGQAIPYPYAFPGYSITVAPGTVGIPETVQTMGKVQNVPNPFANRTQIEFTVAKPALVTVRVFNMVGEELWSERMEARAGLNKMPFDASKLGSGVYLYKVETNGLTYTGRMVVNR